MGPQLYHEIVRLPGPDLQPEQIHGHMKAQLPHSDMNTSGESAIHRATEWMQWRLVAMIAL